jgi:very-short-patch-repair endonuclease
MNVLVKYITFLKEYKKLLERGVKNILSSTVSNNFIWINEIEELIQNGICESNLPEIFSNKNKKQSLIFSLEKPMKPKIKIPIQYINIVKFDEAKNKFDSINENSDDYQDFLNSNEGKLELDKLKKFKKNKEIYSKLFRACNDIKNDSNLEIVLSVGFIQYSRMSNNSTLSKVNQHLFHFPLSIFIDSKNVIKISFSEIENPYSDFFFLNNTPIVSSILNNIIEAFDRDIKGNGYELIFENGFKDLIENSLQKISSNTEFQNTIYKPEKDFYFEDIFKISFSPAINIKYKKPRFFEKLADSIIKHYEDKKFDAKLFNFLVRNPQSTGYNSYTKSNYFIDELFDIYKDKVDFLKGDEDFSVFFPLPFNKEQKQIYENYLKNRLTVVTGPPGTGKSHTIVNILCSLLAQGKRVLVTAQTDKALESLLNKIPETFDDLIFTKIELENRKENGDVRFSLEGSIEKISRILTDNFHNNIDSKIIELDNLKSKYVKLKTKIIETLEKEFKEYRINDSFNNLKAFEIIEKIESKELEEWEWIQDQLNYNELSNIDSLIEKINEYKEISKVFVKKNDSLDVDILKDLNKVKYFDFKKYLKIQSDISRILYDNRISEGLKNKFLDLKLKKIIEIACGYSNKDIVLKNITEIEQLLTKINISPLKDNYIINKTFSDLSNNGIKYLNDIESYLSFLKKDKVSFFTKLTSASFDKVSYLEQFTVNGVKCNNSYEIEKLRLSVKKIIEISNSFSLLKQKGYNIIVDDISNLAEKISILNEYRGKVLLNKEIVLKIQYDSDFINFSEIYKIDLFDIDNISRKAISIQNDFEELIVLDNLQKNQISILNNIENIIELTSLKIIFEKYFPIHEIDTIHEYENFSYKLNEIIKQIEIEETFFKLKSELSALIPKTIHSITNVPSQFITKENFEYASANQFLMTQDIISFQKCKEELTSITDKIYKIKCDILFDLAKSNFRNNFNLEEINSFINLLKEYKITLDKSKQGLKDKVKFQILARQNSIEISKKLSCWVMKFNDVLNSVGNEPEIFDCIIVDEASQLDFNSLILGYYSKNMIIVGDDKQTSPTALGGAESNRFNSLKEDYLDYLGDEKILIRSDLSLFSLAGMVAGTANVELREHFRCVPEIIEFSKREFYNNTLRPLKQINSYRLNPKETFFVNDSYLENQIVHREVEEIKKYLQKILNEKQYEKKTIGVVSLGLAKHTEKLKDIKEDLISEFGKDKIDKYKLIIEDSPKFQGDERDVMIVSLGVAIDIQLLQINQDARPRAIISDQDEFKKINVALSRAKEQMVLFHSVKSDHLKPNDFRNRILSFFQEEIMPFQELILPDVGNISRTYYNFPKTDNFPIDSWFEYDIARALYKNGYKYIQSQYQVKEDEFYFNPRTQRQSRVHFKLDLVVHNNGRMIAIECDGDPFHSLPEDVAYDIERQEFLERVGWKIYRVLYSAFKRSPQDEIQKIIDFIEENTKKDKRIIVENTIVLEEEYYNEIKYNDEEDFLDFDLNIESPEIGLFEENAAISNYKSAK